MFASLPSPTSQHLAALAASSVDCRTADTHHLLAADAHQPAETEAAEAAYTSVVADADSVP